MGTPISKDSRDIEELKKQWIAMIDTIADPLVLIDNNYNIIRLNNSYLQIILKKNPNINYLSLINNKCYIAFANKDSPCKDCLLKQTNEKTSDIEWTTSELFPDQTYTIRAHIMNSIGVNNIRYVIHYRDITLQTQLQKRLAHADKLAAIGKLASGVAHEINSPLAGILAFTQILMSEIDKKNRHREDLEQIESAAKKCKEIVDNLLSFARHETKIVEKHEIHLIAEIQKTLKLAKGFLQQKHIKIDWNIENNNDIILGDSGQIGQIFLNLITNAIQAMKNGGVLSFERMDEEKFIYIIIEDTGSGIKPEIIDKIFDPFFTTKPVGEGTGLGLSITYSLVKQHGGEISVTSIPNEGTKFKIKLPKKID
ncbi:ATP-binding protein [Silvanigrella sp.]|jgi:two-component system NtrC family sensor kinase|uniref:ATP-binding protein n=1 Tax=Silvanigrella sp. TaxID=2024976 RepID=UPI0037C8CDBB